MRPHLYRLQSPSTGDKPKCNRYFRFHSTIILKIIQNATHWLRATQIISKLHGFWSVDWSDYIKDGLLLGRLLLFASKMQIIFSKMIFSIHDLSVEAHSTCGTIKVVLHFSLDKMGKHEKNRKLMRFRVFFCAYFDHFYFEIVFRMATSCCSMTVFRSNCIAQAIQKSR